MSPSTANLDYQGNTRRMVGPSTANLDYQGNARRMVGPPTANLDYQGNIRRMVGIDLQRSEFEDFMNAYRPTLDVPRRELKSGASSSSSEDPKVDLGRSIKRLIKRNQPSPATQQKNRREGFQRTSETYDKERSITNELRPPPVPSQEKKAKRPWSVQLDGSGHSTPSHDGSRTRTEASPVRVVQEHNPGHHHSTKNGKSKTERSSAARDLEQQPQKAKTTADPAALPPKAKTTADPAALPPKNGSKPKADKSREEQQVQVKVHVETGAIPSITHGGSAPSPLNTKKKVSVKNDPPKTTKIDYNHDLEQLSDHCLVVTASTIDRYLPPKYNPDPLLSLRTIQVPERKYHIILEFQESPTYQRPKTSASGLLVISDDDDAFCSREQRMAFEWLRESHLAMSGMLLENVEKMTDFPFVTYLLVSGNRKDLCVKMAHLKQRPFIAQRQQLNFLAGYEETVAVEIPPIPQMPDQPTSDKAGFVISLYQVNPGEDGEKFEQNWVTWTGARQLYCHMPEWMGLKRISIHKSVVPMKLINYVLICEFSSIMDYITDACVLIDELRARCCGFTGVYRILDIL